MLAVEHPNSTYFEREESEISSKVRKYSALLPELSSFHRHRAQYEVFYKEFKELHRRALELLELKFPRNGNNYTLVAKMIDPVAKLINQLDTLFVYFSAPHTFNTIYEDLKTIKLLLLDFDNTVFQGAIDEQSAEQIRSKYEVELLLSLLKEAKTRNISVVIVSNNYYNVIEKALITAEARKYIDRIYAGNMFYADKIDRINTALGEFNVRAEETLFVDDDENHCTEAGNKTNVRVFLALGPLAFYRSSQDEVLN